jgi:hypothetical protein
MSPGEKQDAVRAVLKRTAEIVPGFTVQQAS